MACRIVLAVAIVSALLCTRGTARADASTAHTVQVLVLSLDSGDAEEQADALTGALRSRIRASQGWSLVETTQSLGMLTAALRCTGKPITADCEQRIADQLKTERYIFGYVTKGPGTQVTAEIHLFQKNKPDTVVRESFSENLKDQNDDNLRAVAQRLLDRLGGNAVGVVVVHFGTENGEMVVDGEKHVPLEKGTARLDLSPGSHSVEVSVTGQGPQKRTILVTAGKETVVELGTTTVAPTRPKTTEDSKPFPTRKVVGGALAAAGIVGATIAIVNVVAYLKDQKTGEDFEKAPFNQADRKLPLGKSADDVCGTTYEGVIYADNFTICKANDDATRHSTIALISGAAGAVLLGAGAYLFFTDSRSEGKPKVGAARGVTVKASPTFSAGSGGFLVSGTF